jgi:ribosome-associated translation inhibitor RaiA
VLSQPSNTVAASDDTNLILNVTPTANGAWSVNLSISNNDSDESTYNWTISGTAMGRFNSWAGGSSYNGDSNGDGIKDGIAWVLGAANASSNATALLPVLDNTTDPQYFIYTYRRRDDANTDTNTAISVEYSSSLTGWTSAVDTTVNVNNNGNIEITETNDGYGAGVDKVEVKIKRTLAVGNKLFSRLNVNITP